MEGHSCNLASHIFDIGVSSIREWANAYKVHDVEKKVKKFKPHQYDSDIRVHVVEYMHEPLLSGSEAASFFNIPSSTAISPINLL